MEPIQFNKHVILCTLNSVHQALKKVAELQNDTALSQEDKDHAIALHEQLVLMGAHLLKPYLNEACELFPKQAPLFQWMKQQHDLAIEKQLAVVCLCAGCKPE